MAINFNALLVGGATGWHTGSRAVTYSFISRVPNYYPTVDTDGNGSSDSRGILTVGPGNPDEVVDPAADVTLVQVLSSVSYALSSNVENLTLIGTNPINGTGNNLSNTIVGNAAAN